MAVIAEPVTTPVSRFHFFLDRREVLELFLVAPAIIYVLLLVGLPLLLAVYYSVSAYTIYDPTSGSGGMLVHSADYLREQRHHATSARYFAQEMNWGNAAIGKINSVLTGWRPPSQQGTAPSRTRPSRTARARCASSRWCSPISRSLMNSGG